MMEKPQKCLIFEEAESLRLSYADVFDILNAIEFFKMTRIALPDCAARMKSISDRLYLVVNEFCDKNSIK
jgi:hypothetical protein